MKLFYFLDTYDGSLHNLEESRERVHEIRSKYADWVVMFPTDAFFYEKPYFTSERIIEWCKLIAKKCDGIIYTDKAIKDPYCISIIDAARDEGKMLLFIDSL